MGTTTIIITIKTKIKIREEGTRGRSRRAIERREGRTDASKDRET